MKALLPEEARNIEGLFRSGQADGFISYLTRLREEVRADFEDMTEEKDLHCNRGKALMLSELLTVLQDTAKAPQLR